MINYKYALEETLPPQSEPLSLAEVKNYIKVEHEADDSLIDSLIASARIICELMTGVNLINRNYSMYLDNWLDRTLYLPMSPVQSVTAIKTYNEDNVATDYDISNFYLDNKNLLKPRIVLNSGAVTPMPVRTANGVEIQITSGFGVDATSIPQLLKQGMLQLIAYMYESRGDSLNDATKLSGAREIFKSYRKVSMV